MDEDEPPFEYRGPQKLWVDLAALAFIAAALFATGVTFILAFRAK